MDFYENLFGYLKTNENIQSEFGDRIYPINHPERLVYPAIIYTPISTKFDKNLKKESGYIREIVQFSIYNNSFGKAKKSKNILRDVIKDFSGNMGSTKIEAVHSVTDNILKSDTSQNYDIEEFVCVVEFEFHYNN